MLDAMDVQIFSFAIPAIIVAFAITNADAGLIGTVTLLTSAFGGWFAGALSDRFGRVRTLQITIVWFAFFTFLCGFAQTYAQLFIFRALMGLGFGGEWAAGAVLMGEVIRPQHRGKASGSRSGCHDRLFKNHHLRNKSVDGSDIRQPITCTERAKILGSVTLIIRLMIILRKKLQEPFIVGPISMLERVNEHQASTGLKDPGTFAKDDAPYLRWQFVKQENAGYSVLAVVG